MPKDSEITQCPYCFAEIDAQARKCCYCGEWVDERKAPHEIVTEKFDEAVQSDSAIFAVIALVCLFVWPPLGFILCLIGLFTGPRKGCFGAMIVLFILLPLVLMIFGIAVTGLLGGGIFFPG
jgi:hypothetical protein